MQILSNRCLPYLLFHILELPAGFTPGLWGIIAHQWCVDGLFDHFGLDYLILTNNTDVYVTNNLDTPVRLELPTKEFDALVSETTGRI